jgi:SAM-dependent methyltransferase
MLGIMRLTGALPSMSAALDGYRQVWDGKPVLRAVYDDFYERIAARVRPGPILEIGGGIGNLRQRIDNVISTDIQFAPWLDCVADAQALPLGRDAVANIVMVDVLHHVEFPIRFFREASRVLRPGGRVIMVEPAITWGSSMFYRLFHHEPVRIRADPLAEGARQADRDPYDANQAIPTLIATRDRDRFHASLPDLKITRTDWFSLLVWPLSGGFKRWSLVSSAFAVRLLKLERRLEPLIGRHVGFRVMLTIDKIAAPRRSA